MLQNDFVGNIFIVEYTIENTFGSISDYTKVVFGKKALERMIKDYNDYIDCFRFVVWSTRDCEMGVFEKDKRIYKKK